MDPMKRTEYYSGFTIKGSARCMINLPFFILGLDVSLAALLKISLSCLSLMYLGENSELKFFSPILDQIHYLKTNIQGVPKVPWG